MNLWNAFIALSLVISSKNKPEKNYIISFIYSFNLRAHTGARWTMPNIVVVVVVIAVPMDSGVNAVKTIHRAFSIILRAHRTSRRATEQYKHAFGCSTETMWLTLHELNSSSHMDLSFMFELVVIFGRRCFFFSSSFPIFSLFLYKLILSLLLWLL